MNISKKISFITFALLSCIALVSCKKEVKKESAQFSIESKTITVKWIGYKTTDKVAVKGQFKEINIMNIKSGVTALAALNGAEFSIPISSLFTDEPVRDSKLKQLFFGVMDNTLSLSGTLNLGNDGTGSIDLLMNGVQQKMPITYIISGQLIELEGTMNLNDWNGQTALASINEACFDLHKGPDGVSKTWSEVAVSAAVHLKKK